MKILSTILLLGLAICSVAFTHEGGNANEDSLQIMQQQQRALKADLDDGVVEGLAQRQLGVIRKAQNEFFTVTEGKSTLDQLSMDEKIRLENALERINATVVGTRAASDAQDVCWREAKSGSAMKVTRCGTQAERDQVREGARAWMEKPKVCVPPGCGG